MSTFWVLSKVLLTISDPLLASSTHRNLALWRGGPLAVASSLCAELLYQACEAFRDNEESFTQAAIEITLCSIRDLIGIVGCEWELVVNAGDVEEILNVFSECGKGPLERADYVLRDYIKLQTSSGEIDLRWRHLALTEGLDRCSPRLCGWLLPCLTYTHVDGMQGCSPQQVPSRITSTPAVCRVFPPGVAGNPGRSTDPCTVSTDIFKIKVAVFLHEELCENGLSAGS